MVRRNTTSLSLAVIYFGTPLQRRLIEILQNMQAPILYLIRHGEKPPKLANGQDAQGLSAQGLERAQGLVKVFGKDSDYNINYIIAEKPKKGNDSA